MTAPDKQTISARIADNLIKKIEEILKKENRNRTQVLENIISWYYDNYQPKNKGFKTDFSLYLLPEPKKEKDVISFRVEKKYVDKLEKDCLSDNRNKSQLLECIITEYLVEEKLLRTLN